MAVDPAKHNAYIHTQVAVDPAKHVRSHEAGKPLHYKNSTFHRIIPNFMVYWSSLYVQVVLKYLCMYASSMLRKIMPNFVVYWSYLYLYVDFNTCLFMR